MMTMTMKSIFDNLIKVLFGAKTTKMKGPLLLLLQTAAAAAKNELAYVSTFEYNAAFINISSTYN